MGQDEAGSDAGPLLGDDGDGDGEDISAANLGWTTAWVVGEEVVPDNPTWAVLSDTAFLYSSVLRPVAVR